MNSRILPIVFLALLFSCKNQPEAQTTVTKSPPSVQDTKIQPVNPGEKSRFSRNLIIFYDEKVGSSHLMQAAKEYEAKVIYDYQMMKAIAVSIPDGKPIEDAIAYFRKMKGVTSVSRDQIRTIDPPIKNVNSK